MVGWGWPPKIEGGLDTHVSNLVLNFSKGTEVSLYLPKENTPEISRHNIRFNPVDVETRHSTIESLLSAVKRYNSIISETVATPDLIHIHDWLGVEAGINLRKKLKIPLVMTVHSLEYMRSAGIHHPKSRIADIEKKGIANADIIITVSSFMKDKIIENYSISPDKIKIIPNSSTLSTGTSPAEREKGLVLYCGRLTGQKGVEYLFLAAKDVIKVKRYAKFVIIGKGHIEKQLYNLAELLDIKDHVHFKGFIPAERICQYYKKAEVVVIPSVYEPFGITVLDALEAGAPVIMTKNAGIGENLKDKIHVLKVPERNSKSLADAIISLLDNDGLKKRLSENGKEASRKYCWKNIAANTEDIYRNLV